MLSFELSAEEQELQRSVARFAVDQLRPNARPCEEQQAVPQALVDAFADLGLTQIGCPDQYGGLGLGMSAVVVAEEEVAWGDAGIACGVPRPAAGATALSRLFADEQVPRIVPSESRPGVPVLCFTGTADFSVQEDIDSVVLNGSTAAMPGVHRIETLLLPCHVDGEIALIALPASSPGIQISADSPQLGLRAAPLGKLSAQGCRIPRNHLMARAERARQALRAGLAVELLMLAARAVGIARAAFEYATQYAVQRATFGKPIAEHQAIAFMIADMGTAIDATRGLVWQAAWATDTKDEDQSAAVEAASTFAFDRVVSLTSDAVQILGGHGYIQDHPVEKWMRDARTLANCGAAATELWRSCDVQA